MGKPALRLLRMVQPCFLPMKGAAVLTIKLIRSTNPHVAVTVREAGEYLAFALNYSDRPQRFTYEIMEGWNLKLIYGQEEIGVCDGFIAKLNQEGGE